jgi:cholesterol transport system auxiliary component
VIAKAMIPNTSALLRVLALAMVAPLALGGCISVFPKPTPVQLYRFGETVPASAAPAASNAVTVLKGATVFPPAAGGDMLLTSTGSETAYIGGARWVGPASVMFDEALLRAFDMPGSPRLVERGEPLTAASTLRLDVRSFEARYPGPTVVVRVRATLIRNADRTIAAERMFDASVPAADNRQTAIVAGFDSAVDKVIGDIRDWTAGAAPGVKP